MSVWNWKRNNCLSDIHFKTLLDLTLSTKFEFNGIISETI